MKNLAILTTTRADYGLLAPLIKAFKKEDDIKTYVLVTGSHLSPEFGLTISEIIRDEVDIDKKVEILLSSDTPASTSKAMGLALIGFAEFFDENDIDALLVLGDRYECLAVCLAAQNARIPIIHLHGGEITEGAVDNAIRHAISKISYLHFASTEEYRKRIIQMGEDPSRVYNVGAIGVENAMKTKLLEKNGCEEKLGISLNKYAVMTFHPVTLEKQTAKEQTIALLNAISKHNDITFICTKANADTDGRVINQIIEEYSKRYTNIKLFDSLGSLLYLSLLRDAEFVIGNSSSGIIEAPSFNIPTINIGDRQKGRTQALTTINCSPTKEAIEEAILKACSKEFKVLIQNAKNPYEGKNTTKSIVKITKQYLFEDKLKIQKSFYNIDIN